jgi:NAD(P)-dependent dehydrogenase (short-subunit alcohol dehydrogenase family)
MGSTSGLGYGIAEAFIQGGSKVTVNSGKEESVEAHRD